MKAATQKLTRRLAALILVLVLAVGFSTAAWAEGVPRRETPVYKVAFYAANCYQVQDENGRRRGYGYEMMQGLSKYMQCTFDYVGYDKTPAESMEMLRSGEVVSLPAVTVSPTLDENGRVQYATDFRVAAQPLSVHSTLAMAGELFRYYSGAILGGFWQLFTGKAGMEDLSGPIGTVSAVSQAVRYGWRDVLSLMALLTINVGIFNLLPIPALDGCKLLFLAWEGLTGHPVPLRAQSFINTAGMVALLWLMILVTMQDITRFL